MPTPTPSPDTERRSAAASISSLKALCDAILLECEWQDWLVSWRERFGRAGFAKGYRAETFRLPGAAS